MAKREKVKMFGYRTYAFEDHDPAIDTIVDAARRTKMNGTRIARSSGISATTFYNWKNGRTKQPRHSTLAAAARVVGMDFRLVHIRGWQPEVEVKVPRATIPPEVLRKARELIAAEAH